ncbi:MAG: AmmeMemoRadiSam system radical SAM enzyme [Candidatus Bathyarchaeota archaeon]|nr:AmmeMemoRadiSam system radical SAM enzyme [Candidatus Bathyarchaeota archaeon]
MRELLSLSNVRESLFYSKAPNDRVECTLCERRCNIPPEEYGFCKTRLNINGKLYTTVYGAISAVESRPIEIKPFFHYWPGSTSLTFSTWSCNFSCPWCQNWTLSKISPDPSNVNYCPPEDMVSLAVQSGDEGLCASFQEPTLLTDWNIDVFKIGRNLGFYACYVSNGYMTLEALKALWESGMDGLKIDIKGDFEVYEKFCGGVKPEIVWRNVREAKKMGFHVELVNLVITDINDDEACLRTIIERALKEAGPETPIHFTRYYPAYKFNKPATSLRTLEGAYEMAKSMGMLYPYIGNVPGHKYEHTYCPNCHETLIKRYGFTVTRYNITKENRCPKCHTIINIRGRYVGKKRPHMLT